MGYLASGLAHHINNPLATINTFLQLLPAKYDDPDFREKYYELALSEVERIRGLVREIVEAAKIPTGGSKPQRVEDLLQLAEKAVCGEIKAKGVKIEKKIANGLPAVWVQPQAAACLLSTLLQNAISFSPEGGKVEVRARYDDGSGKVIATVRDWGRGIPPENLEKIFEPFFSTAANGLGMGLFVAARIADLQGIEITAENKKPKGAAFNVALPVEPPAGGDSRGATT